MSWGDWINRNDDMPTKNNNRPNVLDFRELAKVLAIVNKDRHPHLVSRRWIFWEEMIRVTACSLTAAGNATGGHDHATVLYGLRRLQDLTECNDGLVKRSQQEYEKVRELYFEKIGKR